MRVDMSENISWIFQKGSWFLHILLVVLLKLTIYQFSSENVSWQLSILFYNLITFYFFHWKVGDPFSQDFYNHTVWEQIVEQSDDALQVRFLALYPALLFVIVNKLVSWNYGILFVYFLSLLMVTIPKLSFMHMKRICGIRSYN
ncbi:Orm1-like membrane protein [Vairimorpha necatrix]|uniref:Orm1-like membrane protein n=1 Tax=Vairimorpha necatrix TaxID=6039 RepID=A0AAX4J8K4_9MICR